MGRCHDDDLDALLGIRERMFRMFDEQASRLGLGDEKPSLEWSPPVDIYESEEDFTLLAELPGVAREDISLEVSGDSLVIGGIRTKDTSSQSESYFMVERPEGRFRRIFRLPSQANPDMIEASVNNGVLRIRVGKKSAEDSTVIEVR